ncbi:MAG TPA: methyltransferase domain-containing protein [Candidatus Eremiobacteraceae bacterium]|nr:methyltransferase domain-containing protein [Candidatus Eremiobacteraceae bacterium]
MPDAWQEPDSQTFIDYGRIFVPGRDEIGRTILTLMPAKPEDTFVCVDAGTGDGWLSRLILERFGNSHMIALDRSPAMLDHARRQLEPFGDRVEFATFRLEEDAWVRSLPGAVRCVVSSLAIHHIDDARKWTLFRNLFRKIEPGGALLIADLIAVGSERERLYAADLWDAEVKRRSQELTGSLLAFDRFVMEQWNWYRYNDPGDKPARLGDQLKWLEETGFEGVSAYWLHAGHAVFGGFKRPQ